MKYDDMILSVGGYGRYQKFFYFLTFMTSVPNGLITLMFVFIHYLPEYRCKIPQIENATGEIYENLLNITIPKVMNDMGEVVWSKCERYNISNEYLERYINTITQNRSIVDDAEKSIIQCDNGWTFDQPPGFQSVATEFNLVCNDAWRMPLAVSVYMAGMGVGACSGILADRFGRRTVFLWSTFLGFAFNGISGFAWNYVSYVFCMFFTGMMGLVNFLVAFIMATEIMDVKHRNMMALGPFVAFSIGYLLSPLVGFMLQNWRWYMWANGLIGVLYIPYFWLMPESPRWLITFGRIEEAKKVLRNIARVNNNKVDVDKMFEQGVELENDNITKGVKSREISFTFVFINSSLLPQILVIFLAWFVTSMVYYALSLNTSNLSGNRFINCLLAALVELPGYVLSWLMLKLIGRPRTIFIFLGISGISCSMIPLLQMGGFHTTVIVGAMVGKASISTVFYSVYVSAAEMSPTLVRNLASGFASVCARIGSFSAPYLLYAGESIHYSIPYLVMGSLAIISSILSILFIPETKGVPLPENRAEAKNNRRFYGVKLWKTPVNREPANIKELVEESEI